MTITLVDLTHMPSKSCHVQHSIIYYCVSIIIFSLNLYNTHSAFSQFCNRHKYLYMFVNISVHREYIYANTIAPQYSFRHGNVVTLSTIMNTRCFIYLLHQLISKTGSTGFKVYIQKETSMAILPIFRINVPIYCHRVLR